MRRLSFLLVLAFSPGLVSAQSFDAARWIQSTEPYWSFGDVSPAARQRLVEALPQLRGCDESFRAEDDEALEADGWGGVQLVQAPDGVTLAEVACGAPPGTGAYGYPLALAVFGSGGATVTEFVILDSARVMAPEGDVTQALPVYADVGRGLVHLHYKYRGAGGCGLLVTYRISADATGRARLVFAEAREQDCSAEPFNTTCDGEPCYDPRLWPVIRSATE